MKGSRSWCSVVHSVQALKKGLGAFSFVYMEIHIDSCICTVTRAGYRGVGCSPTFANSPVCLLEMHDCDQVLLNPKTCSANLLNAAHNMHYNSCFVLKTNEDCEFADSV